jgi:glycosyltransferase involved in cell wall biosynthesis
MRPRHQISSRRPKHDCAMRPGAPLSVLHVITDLSTGGAETALYRLCTANPPGAVRHHVISLIGAEDFGPLLLAAGIGVDALHMPRGRLTMHGLRLLVRIMHRLRPDVVQTWMYHSDLLGGLAARALHVPVVWGIRNLSLDPAVASPTTRLVARILARISNRVPAAIASCSQGAAALHRDLGYQADRLMVIPNGYDCAALAPDPVAGQRLRAEWNIGARSILLGMVARWHPHKDHGNLLSALAILVRAGVDFRCILVGLGMSDGNEGLRSLVAAHGLGGHLLLVGQRSDIAAVMNGLDLHVLSSVSEAFPNVLAESMACGTPCVTTRVGDAALIVGSTGWVVPPQDPQALADAIQLALRERSGIAWEARRQGCRQRIIRNFSIARMASSYATLWRHVARKAD